MAFVSADEEAAPAAAAVLPLPYHHLGYGGYPFYGHGLVHVSSNYYSNLKNDFFFNANSNCFMHIANFFHLKRFFTIFWSIKYFLSEAKKVLFSLYTQSFKKTSDL